MWGWTGVLLMSASAVMAAPEIDRNVPIPVSSITRENLEKLPVGRRLEDLIRTCPVQTIPTVVRPMVDGISAPPGINCAKPDDLRMIEIYKQHNIARAQYGSQPLVWDAELARGAASYAQQLTTLGRVHSSREGRKDVRENLLQSLRGGRSPKAMVGVWIDERRYFRPGVFPNVSTTGNWADVGHYTQMVWPTTTRLGCAIHSDARYDWTVCRYSPPGNRDGSPILMGPRPPVIARPGDIAPPNSSTPILPSDLPRLPVGGGMTQIDPPPPPPPTARDDAPEGKEENHPLVRYAADADAAHAAATDCGNTTIARIELDKMRYALDELKKRLKAARKAKRFSTVKPEDVQKQIDELERKIGAAEERRPRETCPLPPPPPRPSERG